MKKLLLTFVIIVSATANASVTFLTAVATEAQETYGIQCFQAAKGTIRCSSKSPLNGFIIQEKVMNNKNILSFKIFGDVNKVFTKQGEVTRGMSLVSYISALTMKYILTDGECEEFKNGLSMYGFKYQSSMKSQCLDRVGQKATIKVVYQDQLELTPGFGWSTDGTYVKKIIIKH